VRSLQIGSTIDGTTSGELAQLSFGSYASAPQALYEFTVRSPFGKVNVDADIRLSTCVPAPEEAKGYNLRASVLFVVDGAALANLSSSPIVALAESAPDCDGKYATLDIRAQAGIPYLLVVSSSEGRSGRFRLATQVVASSPTPTPLPWGLDRIDQRTLPLDEKYSVTGLSGTTVYVYVLDSGIRVSHFEFLSSSGESNAVHGLDAVERLDYATDCTGHGTHVAATIAGRSFGVAKNAKVISVRVIGCDGGGHVSRLVEGLEFVLTDSNEKQRRPAVVAMSLSTAKSDIVNDAVRRLSEAGIPVVTAAGNEDRNSCNYSPASEPTSITVAASQKDDSRPAFSNSGECVDMFAPGHDILSAWNTGNHASRVQSGTSFACPHVAGAVAVLLSVNPSLPADAVASMIYSAATFEKVANHTGISTKSGSAYNADNFNNRLLYVRPIPSMSLKSPATGYMYIYAVFQVSTPAATCSSQSLTTQTRSTLSNFIADLASTKEPVESWMCCPNGTDTSKCGAATEQSRLFVRLREKETLASARFETLDSGLRSASRIQALKTALQVDDVSISVEPWVVDSDANVFWAAPDLRAVNREGLSNGAIAALASCSAATLIGSIVALYVFLRRRREKQRFSNYLDSVEAHNKQRAQHETIQPLGSLYDLGTPREHMNRENTALRGDILMNLPSTASIQTPCLGPHSTRSTKSLFATRSPFRSTSPLRADVRKAAPAEPGRELAAGDPSFFGRLASFSWRKPEQSPKAVQMSEADRANKHRSTEKRSPF
jgi:subtilisin family serine protease